MSRLRHRRSRHIAFRLEAQRPVGRGELVHAIRGVVASREGEAALEAMDPWLTLFDGRQGLLAVAHTSRDAAVAALQAIRWVGDRGNPVTVTTLGTSGTIRAAKRRYLEDGGGGT